MEAEVLETLQSRLPNQICQWIYALVTAADLPKWTPFHNDPKLPGPQQLDKWCKHAKLHELTMVPDCLGVRDVPGLQFVDASMTLTVMRPVQQARLRWALRSCQRQLEQEANAREDPVADADRRERQQNERKKEEARKKAVDVERPAAQVKVAAAYRKFAFTSDVHGFFQELVQDYAKLDASKLPDRPAVGSAARRAGMLNLLKQALLLAHPDKRPPDASPFEHAMAEETTLKLNVWKKMFENQILLCACIYYSSVRFQICR